MKRLCFLGVLVLCLTPTLVRAHDDDDKDRDRDRWHHDDDKDHHRLGWQHDSVTAAEMTGIGLGGAALIGVAGYLILRKRNASA